MGLNTMNYFIFDKGESQLTLAPRFLCFVFLLCLSFCCQAKEGSDQGYWAGSLALEVKGDFKGALKLLDSVKPDSQWVAQWQARRGWLLFNQEYYQSSYEAYKKALSLNAKFVDATTGILLPLVEMNRWQEVSSRSRRILADFPSQYSAHYYLCLSDQKYSRWSQMLVHTNQALALYPMSVAFLSLKAKALDHLGQIEATISTYSQVLLISPENSDALNYMSVYSSS